MNIYPERLNRDFRNSDEDRKILNAYDKILLEDATANAKGTLDAIMGMFKDKHDNDIYKMAVGMKKSYDKNGGFSKDQAKWIYNTSKALFKK